MGISILELSARDTPPVEPHPIETFESDIEKLPLQVEIARTFEELAIYSLLHGNDQGLPGYDIVSPPLNIHSFFVGKPGDTSRQDILREATQGKRGYDISVTTLIPTEVLRPNVPPPNWIYRTIFSV